MQARLEKMRAEGKDEYDIKKQEELAKETLSVIPDCRNRLRAAYEELKQLLEQNKDQVDAEAEEVKAANESLGMAAPVIQVA